MIPVQLGVFVDICIRIDIAVPVGRRVWLRQCSHGGDIESSKSCCNRWREVNHNEYNSQVSGLYIVRLCESADCLMGRKDRETGRLYVDRGSPFFPAAR